MKRIPRTVNVPMPTAHTRLPPTLTSRSIGTQQRGNIADDHCEQLFWIHLQIIAEILDIPRKED